MFLIESCAKQQIKIDDLSEKQESAKIPIELEQHSYFRCLWQSAKARKQSLT